MMLEITDICGRIEKGGIYIQNRDLFRQYITPVYRNKTIKEKMSDNVRNSAIVIVRLHNTK